jgi:hypothetical protein
MGLSGLDQAGGGMQGSANALELAKSALNLQDSIIFY